MAVDTRYLARAIALAGALALIGCGGSDGDGDPDAGPVGGARAPFPSLYCPGSPGCDGAGDNVLRVGAARADINPDLASAETEWVDEDGDGEWDATEDFTDTNGNGEFDAVWLAGFGNGRPATGFHSDIWVRAIVFEYNDIRVGLAVVDAVGWFLNDMDASRELIDPSLELDHVLIASIHVHETPDTVGLWGKQELVPGTDDDYQRLIHQRTADAIEQATANLEEVTMSIAQVETVDENGSSLEYVSDARDPVTFDPTMTVMQFSSVASPGDTVATLINWAAHPEYSGDENNEITADYVYLLREVVEMGAAENTTRGLSAIEGLGGEVVFVNGALGGQVGPSGTAPIGLDGTPLTDEGLETSDALGRNLGRLALEAITASDGVVDVTDPDLVFRTGLLDLTVENTFYHVGGLVEVFDRPFHGYDDTQPIDVGNFPYIESRVSYLQVGPVAMISAPGELHPELFIGGYDGSRTYGRDFIDPNNENPPPVAMAPEPPYLQDLLLMNDGVQFGLLLGLTEDFAGYIVPSYNYILGSSPYIEEADGDHYEETNSVGPDIEDEAVGAMRQLITWQRPSD
jgi:hypothetical protein